MHDIFESSWDLWSETPPQTYKDSKRVDDIREGIDSRADGGIRYIEGTGTRFRKTMWLDLGGR